MGLEINLDRVARLAAQKARKRITLEVIHKQEEKRLVTAWASVVSDDNGQPIVDADQDVILISDLEDAVNKSFADGGRERGKVMHSGKAKADIVQFFTLSKIERQSLGFGEGREGLIVKFRVNDPETWEAVKAGFLPELSIGGSGERIPI